MLYFRSHGDEKSSEAESPYDVIVLSVIPAFHAYGMVVIMTVMLLAGAQVITLPRFHPEQYLATIEKYKVNCKAHIPLEMVTPNARGPNETYILPARIGLALDPWGFTLGPQGFFGFSGYIVVAYRHCVGNISNNCFTDRNCFCKIDPKRISSS